MAEREHIPGTPFTIIKLNEEYFMVMGDYRITETTKTKEEQLEKLESEKWLLIMHIAIITIKKLNEKIQYEEGYNKAVEEYEHGKGYETESL